MSGLTCEKTLTVTASAPQGSAYGVYANVDARYSGTAVAQGKYAYGAYAELGTLTLSSTSSISAPVKELSRMYLAKRS